MKAVFPPSLIGLVFLSHSSHSFLLPPGPSRRPTSPRKAVTIDQGQSSAGRARSSCNKRIGRSSNEKGRNRSFFKRVFRKSTHEAGSEREQATRMNAVALPMESESALVSHQRIQDGFVLRNFEQHSPEELFKTSLSNQTLPLELVVNESAKVSDEHFIKNQAERKSRIQRISQSTFENILLERLERWSSGSNENVKVTCEPTRSAFQLVRGRFYCDATVELDRIVFGNIQFSGGRLEAKDFALNLLSFTSIQSSPRYPQRFDLLAKNLTFTQDDLFQSSCIRNGLRRLLTRILRGYGLENPEVGIHSIEILPGGKISVTGKAAPLLGPPVSFEVRSGLGFSRRGHVLDFPGLELSIQPALGVFVPILPAVTVDLGHNAQLLDIQIDKDLRLSSKVTITPDHTVLLKNYRQCSSAFGALCSVDVGRWLTRIGRFAQ